MYPPKTPVLLSNPAIKLPAVKAPAIAFCEVFDAPPTALAILVILYLDFLAPEISVFTFVINFRVRVKVSVSHSSQFWGKG